LSVARSYITKNHAIFQVLAAVLVKTEVNTVWDSQTTSFLNERSLWVSQFYQPEFIESRFLLFVFTKQNSAIIVLVSEIADFRNKCKKNPKLCFVRQPLYVMERRADMVKLRYIIFATFLYKHTEH
jgi:hypothetical protein